MKKQALQKAYTMEERIPSVLPVAEEKNSVINIYNNEPIIYKDSPFESRNNSRKKYPNEQAFIPFDKDQMDSNSEYSIEKSEENYKNKKRNELINYVSEPYSDNDNINNEQRIQNKMYNRKKNIEENYRKKKESPENNSEEKKLRAKKMKVEINKLEGLNNNYRYNYTNNSKSLNNINNNNYSKGSKINDNEYIYYNEPQKNYDESSLSNVSFSNKNIDTKNYNYKYKTQRNTNDIIYPNNQNNQTKYKLKTYQNDNEKIIKRLQKEKENLKKENKKLTKDYSNLEKERQKFENEKKLFFESRNRVIDDSRKNEERLLKLENNFKIKEETQNYNINLNIDKTRKEQELLKKKEQEINELKKNFLEKQNNLSKKENDLLNKENELQEKEIDLNNKYQNLIEKENYLKGEKEKFINNTEENKKDLFIKSQELKNKEEQLTNRENLLVNKENEMKNREYIINSVEIDLKNKEKKFHETQNILNNQQNEINDKEKKINLLNKEIKDKRNQIIELNNTYNNMISKMSSPKSKSNQNLEESKDSKDLNNPPQINRPSISAVKKIDRKFNPNMSSQNSNVENKVVTFGPNKNSVESNLTNKYNSKDIRDNDSYPENHLKDIKDNDAFPENHLHDIEDNDNYPENHGEDDFIFENNNNINNEEEEEKYEDMEQDFNQYINNQSENDKSKNMSENKNINNNNIPMDEHMSQNEEQKEEENTDPYDFNQENNNDLMMSNNNESKNDIKGSLPNNNDIQGNDFPGNNNNAPENNEQIQNQENMDNLDNENMPNNDDKMSNQIENENNNDINKMNESESQEIELNNNIQDNQNQNIQNEIKEENKINDHSEEINDITEELFVEEYNPSLGLTKINYPHFLNPVIQCFAHIPDITDKILNLHLDLNFKDNLDKIKLAKNYRNLLINLFYPEKLYNMERQAFNPTKFRNAINDLNPLFKENDRIELKEFINYFILKLHDELNTKKQSSLLMSDKINDPTEIKNENDALVDFLSNFTKKNNSIISKNLYGIIKYNLYCHQCQNSIYNFQCYSHLYFNISNILDAKIEKYHREDVQLNLYDCLDYYQKSETLRGDKGIFCPYCKTQTESTSIKSIYSTKNVIIFILDRNIGNNNFNQTLVDFDETLNLRDYVEYKKNGEKTREKFFLGGVINYYLGDDEMNGTYNAFIKMGKRGDWYCYEDENVYSVNFENIKNNGYPVVLFYHKLTKK